MVKKDQLKYGLSKERLELIFDAGTFVELGAFSKCHSNPDEFAGVACGYGAINGKLVFAFAQDSTRMKGAFDQKHAKKIIDMYSLALKNGAPVLGIFDSMGAVVYDGVGALSAYASATASARLSAQAVTPSTRPPAVRTFPPSSFAPAMKS